MQGFHHSRMRMADMADIVETIEIGAAFMVNQPDAVTTHKFDWLLIGN